MPDSPAQTQVDAAEAYERLFVPSLFQQFAPLVLEAAQVGLSQRVLDVGCGTGVLAREAMSLVGPRGSVSGVDVDAGMLAVAARLSPTIEWRQGAAESLPFADGSFHRVLSQFGLMFFRDRSLALREMLRVLVPSGRFAVAVWDSLDHQPAYAAEVALLERLAGRPAADALRAPFVLGDRGDLLALFAKAGARSPDISTHPGTARFPSVRSMVEADVRGWFPLAGIVLAEDVIERIVKETERILAANVDAEGHVAFDVSAHIVTGDRE